LPLTDQILWVLIPLAGLTFIGIVHFTGSIENAPLPFLLLGKAAGLVMFGCVALLFVRGLSAFTPWWTRIFPALAALCLFAEITYFDLMIGATPPFRASIDPVFGSFGEIAFACLLLSLLVGLVATIQSRG
jgi:hypothetical protein